ncbi:hypothetical protein CC85DRAFT_260142 [Cutaneotrichosporon oleaginosum]|uniref:PCI domain-containing protein n=1 Tax=Cutaneotrichosporon oleaginosum TaxID=879819 RepID=A0A0J1B4D4_9TREE|nr:uncharacterized protein CC85DRAFT_260142 [Cutaneotrichosporon oleaginosum]KLT42509.1 hypothetical protein CC85DRAFT_260142 [Cutaneotrichosporon oleaginosum]TXT07781.1 hypothetical protein COLE_04705 [Cutaneotrichosporon oleaginosum]
MDGILSTFFGTVAMAFAVGSGDNLAMAVPVTEEHPYYWPLHEAVQNLPKSQLTPQSIMRSLNSIQGLPQDLKWPVAGLLSSVLAFVGDGPGDDADGTYRAFTNILAVHSHLRKLYSQNGDEGYLYPFLNPLMIAVCRRVVQVGDIAASYSTASMREQSSPRSIRDGARQALERSIQVASAALQGPEWNQASRADYTVADALWPLANLLWRMYAARRLHTQAAELAKTFSNLVPSEEERLRARGHVLSTGTLAESYYWRGRLGIVLLDFRLARRWLEKAWGVAPDDGWKQRQSILIKLIPAALLTGSLPAAGVLEEYDLPVFAPLIEAFRDGNVPRWRALLEEHRVWLRAQHIWLLLFERGEIIVWRNLFRHALTAYYLAAPEAPRKLCPTWVFVEAARTAFAGSGELEEDLVLEDIICVLSSLIDQGLIMGNISYSQRQLVMRPPEKGGGFPRVKDVAPRRVQAIS